MLIRQRGERRIAHPSGVRRVDAHDFRTGAQTRLTSALLTALFVGRSVVTPLLSAKPPRRTDDQEKISANRCYARANLTFGRANLAWWPPSYAGK